MESSHKFPRVRAALRIYTVLTSLLFTVFALIAIVFISANFSLITRVNGEREQSYTTIGHGDGYATAQQGQLIQIPLGQKKLTEVKDGRTIEGISFDSSNVCTLGYVDVRNYVAFTARHCVENVGDRIYDSKGNYIGDVASLYGEKMRNITDFAINTKKLDTATIALHKNVDFGQGNALSGVDNYATDINKGDSICRYGAKSKTTVCGTIIKVTDGTVYATDKAVLKGDSGGPAWIPGKGMVGVLSMDATVLPGDMSFPYASVTKFSRITEDMVKETMNNYMHEEYKGKATDFAQPHPTMPENF